MRRGSTGDPSASPFYIKESSKNVQIGFPMVFKVKKNKIGDIMGIAKSAPGSEAILDFYYGSGFDLRSDIVNSALKLSLPFIKIAGSWITFEPEAPTELTTKKEQGKLNFLDSLSSRDLEYMREHILTAAAVKEEKEV